MIRQLKDDAAFPVLKIDFPMAQMAVKAGNKIGVAATFQPTVEPTSNLLRTAATEAGVDITITKEVIPEAYEALLANHVQKHDSLLLEAVRKLEASGVDVIVLAQVSMARLLPLLPENIKVPVLSSLQTSLDAIRDSFRRQ
jgi:aspartate/glutamate racemase